MIHAYIFLVGSFFSSLLYRIAAREKRVSFFYPCLGGFMSIATFQHDTLTLHAILYSTLFLMAVIDHHHMIIPDSLQLIFLVVTFWDPQAVHSLFGALIMFALTYLSDRIVKDGIGGGDVKFLIITGFYFGPSRTSLVLMLASSLALFTLLFKKKNTQEAIPFGPYLIVAFLVVKELIENRFLFLK